MGNIILETVKDISRDSEGRIFAWRRDEVLGEFASIDDAVEYLDANWPQIKNKELRFFSGSASTLTLLNGYIDKKRDVGGGNKIS